MIAGSAGSDGSVGSAGSAAVLNFQLPHTKSGITLQFINVDETKRFGVSKP
jgi:hypothetical protein